MERPSRKDFVTDAAYTMALSDYADHLESLLDDGMKSVFKAVLDDAANRRGTGFMSVDENGPVHVPNFWVFNND